MFVLTLLMALQGVFIGGHMVKSNVHHEIETAEQLIAKNAKIVAEEAIATQANQDFLRSIAFHPSSVDFGAWSIGTARSYLVTLINKNSNKSVHLSSISGSTQEFYSSFFEDKVVPPQGNTTFNVVFLPRGYGPVETDLFIHTSFGQARLSVKGEGRECPYRIKSLIGIKAPFNATISPEILMYNPHPRPIQILEIYSSGGQFQLELPSGGQEGPQALWEIPPHTTKPIIRIRFHAIQPGNHTAFIRIKISEAPEQDEQREENILVIPVEIEIGEDSGLYSPNPVMDFGRLTTADNEKSLTVNLVNSGKHTYQNLEYHVNDVEGLIELDESDLTLRIHPELAEHDVNINGILLVRMWRYAQSNGDNKSLRKYVELSIGLKAEIYRGSLEFQSNRTVFITGTKNYARGAREFPVHNKFSIPVAVLNITLEDKDTRVVRISEFEPTIVPPNEIVNIFKISVLDETANFKTNLRIATNLSSFELPVVVCSGLLKRYTSLDSINLTPLPEDNVLNFGAIQHQDLSHYGYILLHNPNPVPIPLLKWNFTSQKGVYYQAMFLGCTSSLNSPTLDDLDDINVPVHKRFSFCMNVTSQGVAAFELAVQSYAVKSFTAVFQIWTEFEEIATTINFVVVRGRLEVDQSRLHFAECFPGKRCSADISIHSTFVKNMQVNSITVSVPGLIFEYHTQDGLPEIIANSVTDIGRIHFDPKSVCGKRCYIFQDGPASDTEVESLELDEAELRRRTELFRRFKYNLQMITFTLNTSEVRQYEFNSTVDIIWPKLVKNHHILPTIEIGQSYNGEILISNPSSRMVRVEIELADPNKAKSTSLSLPLEVIDNCVYCYLTDEPVFKLGHGANRRMQLSIQPNSATPVPIKFIGNVAGQFSTLLHIYNNLTLYEAVWVTAKAVQPQFRFGNRKPGSTTPLLFEVNEKHLVNCERNAVQPTEPLLVSTKRTFTARNTGEVPIMVEKFIINDNECEGYGFRILDCSSFELKANSSRKVDIAFTPDFTMTRISQPLLIKTNLSSEVNYTLLATVPASSLELCSKAVQRPFWEGHLKKMSVGVLIVAFVFVLIAACIDSDKVLKDHVQNISKDKGPMQPPLDLRNIGIKQSQTEEQTVQGDSITNIVERNANKFTVANIKKRNIKRGSFTPPATVQGKEKSWAEELAKKIRNVSSTTSSSSSSVSSVSPKPTILSKAIQTVSSSAASVATALAKPKDEKVSAQRKSTGKDQFETNKTTIPDKSPQSETEKKSSLKSDLVTPLVEARKQKLLVKKSRSAPMETVSKETDHPAVTFASKPSEKLSSRSTKSSPKDKSDSQQNLCEKKVVEISSDVNSPGVSKRDSSTGNADRTSPRHNTQQKKFGKTPGRERKKEPSSQASSKRKVPKFKGTAFQFTAPLGGGSSSNNSSPTTPSTSTVGTVNTPWDSSQTTSFSNVVAQKSPKSTDESMQTYSDCGLKPMFDETDQDTNNNNHDWNEADLKNHETFGTDTEEKRNSGDLGPIGTKKSPSSTPVWEPFINNNIHRPTASLSSQHSSNTSFFSSHFPIGASFDYTSQFLGGTSGLLDHVFAESQHFDNVPPNELLLTWLQQERLRAAAGWNASSNRTWTPMGYQDDPLPASSTNDQMHVWQPTVPTVVRPPPGLPLRSNRGSPIHQQQQMQSQLPQTQQQSPTQSDGNLTNSVDPLQPYHPYSSFNSIWSDPWNKQEKE